jgi:hypothetical protein
VRKQTWSGSWHLTLQEQINEKSNASAFPYQSKKQHQERTPRVQKDMQGINSSKKKRSVAEATMFECYGIGPRRCILGP